MTDDDEGRWGTESIDLVAEPVRYPRAPLIGLLLVALLPAIGLFVLRSWADGEADKYEATEPLGVFDRRLNGTLAGDEPTDDAAVIDEAVADADSTRLIDFRRTPDAVAAAANADRLRAAIEPVLAFLSPQSCVAVSVDGRPVTSLNPDLPVIPASNQKLLVASAALEVLGDDHRFTTSVAVPPATEGVVEGDIYLIGGGDPLLTSDDYPIDDDRLPAFDTTSLDVLADAIVDSGVDRIRGTVIGDGTRYDDEFVVDEWADGIAFDDAGPYDALLANDSRVRGRRGVQDDPNSAAAREFVRLLGNRGVRVDNGFGSGIASTLVPILASVESAPLTDVVAEMLINSDNNTAEMLVKEIGFVASGEGTRTAGLRAMMQSLERQGVPTDGLTLRDGSGLAATNRVTCAAVLAVLQNGAGGPLADALPIAAETGTLSNEFVDGEMAGRLVAKTGTLGNPPLGEDPPGVKALAGYVPPLAFSGAGTIEFVLIANQELVTDETIYRPLWDAFGERFAAFPNGPTSDSLGPR